MAALRDSPLPAGELLPLRRLTGRELDPILLEETVEWQSELDWDFARSADLIRQYADMRALNGFALLDRGEVVGYAYSVIEEHKGLLGDVYVRPAWRLANERPANSRVTEIRATEIRATDRKGTENAPSDAALTLFRATFDSLMRNPQVKRIESQLMLAGPDAGQRLEREGRLHAFERLLMVRKTPRQNMLPVEILPQVHRQDGLIFENWSDRWLDSAAETMVAAYGTHVDSQINDQYRSAWGARRFLSNIVQYPGCGNFFRPGSVVAWDPSRKMVAGMVLTSFVSPRAGHVTQLCIAPDRQGAGLGYELLRRSIGALAGAGAEMVSLTVTARNQAAIQLYLRCGFMERRRFLACAWDRGGR